MSRGRVGVLAGLVVCLGLGQAAVAGGRPRVGGSLAVAVPSIPATATVPATPLDTAIATLTHTSLCRLVDAAPQSSGTVRLAPLAPPLTATQLAETILRVKRAKTPYAALAKGIRAAAVVGEAVELSLDQPWAEVHDALCHPAFNVALGPFSPGGAGKYVANLEFPLGRPWVDRLTLHVLEPRAAERAFAQDRVQVSLGGPSDEATPTRFATVLALPAEHGAGLRAALDATLDRADLIRFFVRGPTSPLVQLAPGDAVRPTPPKPAPQRPALELTLRFDARSDDHRAVAERLQVKLQPLGYALRLAPSSDSLLEARPGELRLVSLALPATPSLALELFRALAGVSASTPSAAIPVMPLYAEGLGFKQSKRLLRAPRDAWGLPRLDEVWLLGDDG